MYIASFMTAEGQRAWTIIDKALGGAKSRLFSVENGNVKEGWGGRRRKVLRTAIPKSTNRTKLNT
jgi:hypothetical protein